MKCGTIAPERQRPLDMLNRELLTRDAVRAALEPTSDCPTIEELEAFASDRPAAANRFAKHFETCTYCQTEVQLLKKFLAADVVAQTPDAAKAAELLRSRSKQIFRQAFPVPEPTPWWKSAFTVRRMAQVSLAMAALL